MDNSAHISASRETLPMEVENMTFMLNRLHSDCSPLQFIRELTQNAIEAIEMLPRKTGEIIWDVDWNRHALTQTYKLSVIDTGVGMTGEDMVHYINRLSSSVHQQSVEGNYGVGAKIAAVPKNKVGLVYLSWKDDIGYMAHIWHDPDTDQYGLRKFRRPDGTAEYWTTVENVVKPKEIGANGTMVILLGNTIDEDTMQPSSGTPGSAYWVLRYLNTRFYTFPKNITVKAREGWERPKGDQHNFLRKVTGMKPWLDENSLSSGNVMLSSAKIHWWILKDSPDTGTHGRYVGGGHIAALYKDELYEVNSGRAGVARLQAFGVIFGHRQVVIYAEPINGTQHQLTTNTSRTALLSNGEPLPWSDWAAEFREKMPEEIKRLIEEMGASSVTQDHQSIWDRLKQISDLFKFTRYRPLKTGTILVDEPVTAIGGIPQETDTERRDGTSKKGGGHGGRAGDIYALFQIQEGMTAEQIRSTMPQPKTQWIYAAKGTRTPPDLEDRAAKFLPEQNLILVNGDFRVFEDMVDRWVKKYSSAPGARPVIESVVREWFEQQLIESVIGAMALKGSSQWTMQDVEKLWSEEALTSVVLPRYHIDINIKRSLGAKLGSLREIAV